MNEKLLENSKNGNIWKKISELFITNRKWLKHEIMTSISLFRSYKVLKPNSGWQAKETEMAIIHRNEFLEKMLEIN